MPKIISMSVRKNVTKNEQKPNILNNRLSGDQMALARVQFHLSQQNLKKTKFSAD